MSGAVVGLVVVLLILVVGAYAYSCTAGSGLPLCDLVPGAVAPPGAGGHPGPAPPPPKASPSKDYADQPAAVRAEIEAALAAIRKDIYKIQTAGPIVEQAARDLDKKYQVPILPGTAYRASPGSSTAVAQYPCVKDMVAANGALVASLSAIAKQSTVTGAALWANRGDGYRALKKAVDGTYAAYVQVVQGIRAFAAKAKAGAPAPRTVKAGEMTLEVAPTSYRDCPWIPDPAGVTGMAYMDIKDYILKSGVFGELLGDIRTKQMPRLAKHFA